MTLREVISTIDDYAKAWHEYEDIDGIQIDIELIICKYILGKGFNHKIGKYPLSSIIHVFDEEMTGQHDEGFCGWEEDLVANAIQMYSEPNDMNTLTDDYPIEGKYQPIDHKDEAIHMVINYYEALFWPHVVTFRYNLSDFDMDK